MPRLIDYYRAWRKDRRRSRRQILAQPPDKQQISQSTRGLVYRAGLGYHKFALTWDDVGQQYAMLGRQTPVYSMGFTDSDLERLLRASAWSWASINGNARAMAQLTPVVQEQAAGKWTKAAPGHPLWAFLADPLGTDDELPYWSWQHLFYVLALHYYSAGNAWLVPFETREGLSVVPLLSPHNMRVDDADTNTYGAPTRYTYNAGLQGSRQPQWGFAPNAIINIMAPSSSSYWKGESPLRACLRSAEIDHVATERQRYNLRNRIAPGPVITTEYGGPTTPQQQQLKAEIIAQFREPENDGDPIILGGGAKLDRGFKPEELQLFDTKNAARDEIIATIGTQPSILGQLNSATYSNTKEATVLWFTSSINPILQQIYGAINAQKIQQMYPDTRLWYSLSGSHIGLQLLAAQLDVADGLQKLGYDANEISDYLEMGLPALEEKRARPMPADVIAGRVPAGEDEAEDEADSPPEPAIAEGEP